MAAQRYFLLLAIALLGVFAAQAEAKEACNGSGCTQPKCKTSLTPYACPSKCDTNAANCLKVVCDPKNPGYAAVTIKARKCFGKTPITFIAIAFGKKNGSPVCYDNKRYKSSGYRSSDSDKAPILAKCGTTIKLYIQDARLYSLSPKGTKVPGTDPCAKACDPKVPCNTCGPYKVPIKCTCGSSPPPPKPKKSPPPPKKSPPPPKVSPPPPKAATPPPGTPIAPPAKPTSPPPPTTLATPPPPGTPQSPNPRDTSPPAVPFTPPPAPVTATPPPKAGTPPPKAATPPPSTLTPPPKAATPPPSTLTPPPKAATPPPSTLTPPPKAATPPPSTLTPPPPTPVAPLPPPSIAPTPGRDTSPPLAPTPPPTVAGTPPPPVVKSPPPPVAKSPPPPKKQKHPPPPKKIKYPPPPKNICPYTSNCPQLKDLKINTGVKHSCCQYSGIAKVTVKAKKCFTKDISFIAIDYDDLKTKPKCAHNRDTYSKRFKNNDSFTFLAPCNTDVYLYLQDQGFRNNKIVSVPSGNPCAKQCSGFGPCTLCGPYKVPIKCKCKRKCRGKECGGGISWTD